MNVIETSGLRKEYKSLFGRQTVAVDSLNLSVGVGGVHGFLGPNGSGKTTTIRCLLGLIRPSHGGVRLLGQDTTKSLSSVVDRVGALVETPKFFPAFSGRKNLLMLAGLAGIPGRQVDAVLETVSLGERGKDRFSDYSLGMKQRLAIAATLLKDPELIILDEPANGLDPAGIVEIRQLLRRLGENGKTIFVSSHQLNEIQQTCDVVTIISKGRIITSGPVDEVVAAAGSSNQIIVTIADIQKAAQVMQSKGFVIAPINGDPDSMMVSIDVTQGASIAEALASAGMFPRAIIPQQVSLESIFLHLTAGEGTL